MIQLLAPCGAILVYYTSALGVVNFLAFYSFFTQYKGLIGRSGLLPIAEHLKAREGGTFLDKVIKNPTFCWFGASDRALALHFFVGMALSFLLAAQCVPYSLFIVNYALYYSLVVAGQDFFTFQWDSLLLEANFITSVFSCLTTSRTSFLVIYIVRYLNFRLNLASGLCKLTGRCPEWMSHRAMSWHYWTQPLPNPLSPYAHRLPPAFHNFSARAVTIMMVGAPWLVLIPSATWKLFSFSLVMIPQIAIAATGNYGFFNLLTSALSLSFLTDDCLPDSLVSFAALARPRVEEPGWLGAVVADCISWIAVVFVGVLYGYCCLYLLISSAGSLPLPTRLQTLLSFLMGLKACNRYGLFATMTVNRREINLEEFVDGTWRNVDFKYKPVDLQKAPRNAFFHMPRLDWEMWFASLSQTSPPIKISKWIDRLIMGVLTREPSIVNLLNLNDRARPEKVRVRIYHYTFAHSLPCIDVVNKQGLPMAGYYEYVPGKIPLCYARGPAQWYEDAVGEWQRKEDRPTEYTKMSWRREHLSQFEDVVFTKEEALRRSTEGQEEVFQPIAFIPFLHTEVIPSAVSWACNVARGGFCKGFDLQVLIGFLLECMFLWRHIVAHCLLKLSSAVVPFDDPQEQVQRMGKDFILKLLVQKKE